jgi:Spy/CpxP family protein refolding chaperone
MKRNLLFAVVFLGTSAIALSPSLLLAQPGGPPRGPGGPGGPGGFFGGAQGSLIALVQRPEIQQELQLIDEQRDKVDEVVTDARDRIGNEMRTMFADMGNINELSEQERQARFDEIRVKFEKLNKEFEGDLKKALLPHQFDRLKQIGVQQRVQTQGANALSSGELAEALSLTDEQREKLEKRSAEVQQELQEKIAQLRLEARNKMLDVLTPEQRTKLNTMMGDAFAMPDGGFGVPGGFQGRGGGRGGFFGGGGRGDRGRGDEPRRNNGAN